ncbi:B-type flagellin [Thermoanaerobacter kivui]|uniref:Flagellin n=1 Tax=Thermoanaerobacter kivui TaxID=2325 RepID=A0A097APE8_THEKI|nr:B-type flagellin [Thermoanaerobacter kivui]
MIINHNLSALNAWRALSINTANTQKALEKLSSGLRINRAGDDAAGLAISEKMRGQIRGLEQASRNAQDAISLIQTAEGGLNEVHSILQRMRELAVQAANGTLTNDDRAAIQAEIDNLKNEVNRIANQTEFNTMKLLNGSLGTKVTITSGNEVTAASVTGTISTTGSFTIDLIRVGAAHVLWSNAPTKDDGSGNATSVSLDTTSSLNTLFGSGAFDGTQQLVISQGSQTINVALKGDDTIAGIINTINQRAQELKMNITASFDSVNGKILLTSTETGMANSITVSEVGFTSNVTFGWDDQTTAADYQYTVTNNTTGITSATLSSATKSATINDTTSGLTGVTVVFGNTASGTAATINITSNAVDMHIGANENQVMEIALNDMRATALGVGAIGKDINGNTRTSQFANLNDIDVSTSSNAEDAIITIDKAINEVSAERSKLGAYQNRLEHTINNLSVAAENLTAAESRIRDVDMAQEMMEFTKNNILNQAATAMLAQANQLPQTVLQLLR